jgi:hypothetical protein
MRSLVLASLVVCLHLTAAPLRADDTQKEAQAVIDRAIKAAGGEAKLKKTPAFTFKGKGTASEGGNEISFNFEGSGRGIDQARLEMELSAAGQAEKVLVVIHGDKGWLKARDKTEKAPKEILDILKAEYFTLRLVQHLPLAKDKACKLSHLGEVKVGGKPAVGVKVARKGFPAVDIYFDKKSNLPVKAQLSVKEPEQANEISHVWLFSDYKANDDGVKQFQKATLKRDGKETAKIEVSEWTREEKLEDSDFEKP